MILAPAYANTARRWWRRAVLVLVAGLMLVGVLPAVGQAQPSEHPFEILPGSFHFVPSTLQAGARSDWVTSFDLAHEENGSEYHTYNDVRENVVNLPTGFDANDTAVPTCTQAQLGKRSENTGRGALPECPVASQVGLLSVELNLAQAEQVTVPVYMMETTSFGVTAELGYNTGEITGFLRIQVRPGDLGLVASATVPPRTEVRNVVVTVWGVPAAAEHDSSRAMTCIRLVNEPQTPCQHPLGPSVPAGIPAKPFLSNPTSCGMFEASIRADSWESEAWSPASTAVGPTGECERVPFEPSIDVQPSTRAAESPTGLEVSLVVPQVWEDPLTISTANLKDATVTLPEGMTANPSLAAGLGACTPEQYERETPSSSPGAGCPPESKIGSIDIETPLLAETIHGAVYIAKPYENPFSEPGHPHGSLLALYVVAKDPLKGVIVKVAGKVEPDPLTGRLVTSFLNNPQQPFSRFTLKFRPGATAPLVSPPVCGTYTTRGSLTPWSAPLEPKPVSSSFQVTQGAHEDPCPSGGAPPFHPQVLTGTQNNAAGSYSPFYLRLIREDGEQELTRFSTIMPPGLTGNLTGIPFCPEAAIEVAKRRGEAENGGALEETQPSCPASSQVGHTLVGAGVGPVLAENPGRLYLAGPYHGAPLSLVSITSAKVGPFDLGTVVIRFALRINPVTAQVEVDATGSDPIPHIIKGIIVHVRDIRAYVDRPDFILNPTSCEHMSIGNVLTGAGADPANPADQTPVNVSSPFQATDCASLSFKPSFTVTTTGRTNKADGASLNVKLTMPGPLGAQANIHQVKVELPVQLPSRLTTLQKACTKSQFDTNPAGCPAASVVGHARAITPILPVPLEGPAYFVSNGGEAFPNLIIVLQGYGVTIDLVGDTFISKQGITSSTFKTVPDQPVTSFELTLPQGPFSALTANGNLCALTRTVLVKKRVTIRTRGHRRTITRRVKQTLPASLSMPTEFVAQNGATLHRSTPVGVTGCAKARPAKKAKHSKKASKKKG
ncbi:MAG TPA: hypothetical protein VNY27_03265 [Solirubrobacteraceae bacterium]|nr:hypothetical protein [Solirubrobacteraceae bacterium]